MYFGLSCNVIAWVVSILSTITVPGFRLQQLCLPVICMCVCEVDSHGPCNILRSTSFLFPLLFT